MLVVKYTKLYPLSAISHIDLLKVFQRIIRRAKVKVAYSQGFNPHMKIYFSPPVPLGVESLSEYVTIDTPEKATQEFFARFNDACPLGIKAVEVFQVEKNPNLAKEVVRAEYVVNAPNIGKLDFSDIVGNSDYVIEYLDKDKNVATQKAGESIYSIEKLSDDAIKMVLDFGNKNLKAQRFVRYICEKNGIDFLNCAITKINAYTQTLSVDEFLTSFD